MLDKLKAGDKIRFVAEKSATGYVVTDLQPAHDRPHIAIRHDGRPAVWPAWRPCCWPRACCFRC